MIESSSSQLMGIWTEILIHGRPVISLKQTFFALALPGGSGATQQLDCDHDLYLVITAQGETECDHSRPSHPKEV